MTDEAKKKWAVRTWQYKTRTHEYEAEDLERVLNELESNEYRVYKLDLRRRQVVAYHHPEPKAGGLVSLLFGDRARAQGVTSTPMREDGETEPAPPPEPQDENEYNPKGEYTNRLVNALTHTMTLRASGDPNTKERVCSAVKQIFNGVGPNETGLSLHDVKEYHRLHIKNATGPNGTTCGGNCSIHTVLEIAEVELSKRLEANPTS